MKKYKQREVLYEMYHERGMSTNEIADELGCGNGTVWRWMDRLGIEMDTANQDKPVYHVLENNHGYEVWQHNCTETRTSFGVHRLVAIAEYGFEAVDGKHVHHKNGHRFDNRPCNLKPLTQEEHMELHHKEWSENTV